MTTFRQRKIKDSENNFLSFLLLCFIGFMICYPIYMRRAMAEAGFSSTFSLVSAFSSLRSGGDDSSNESDKHFALLKIEFEDAGELPKNNANLSLQIATGSDIEQFIINTARKYKIDENLLMRIAICEDTNLEPTLKNPEPNSTATGIFQWTIGSWRHYSKIYWGDMTDYRKDYKKNIELAGLVMRDYGLKDWEASRQCWIN